MTSVKLKNQCNYCKRSILRAFHIICAECPDCLLCGDCFSAGVEMGKHKNNHKYKVADCLEYPLFVKDWTVNEELALLEGVLILSLNVTFKIYNNYLFVVRH